VPYLSSFIFEHGIRKVLQDRWRYSFEELATIIWVTFERDIALDTTTNPILYCSREECWISSKQGEGIGKWSNHNKTREWNDSHKGPIFVYPISNEDDFKVSTLHEIIIIE